MLLTIESVAKRMMKSNNRNIKIEELNSQIIHDEIDKTLVTKYFKKNKFDEQCVLIRLFNQQTKRKELSPNGRSLLQGKNRLATIKKRAFSPQPKVIYFGVKDSAFFNKRAGILKPNIKFRVLNLVMKNKQLSGGEVTGDIKNAISAPQSPKQKFSSEVISMMAKYTKRFSNDSEGINKIAKQNEQGNFTLNNDKSNEERDKINKLPVTINKQERFKNISKLFDSNKYISRIKINSTFKQFNNIISEEEIETYGQKIWSEAHNHTEN